jgi:hypothetical protein
MESTKKSDTNPWNIVLIGAVVLLIAGGCFYGGIAYEKGHVSTANVSKETDGSGFGGYGGRGGYGGGDRVVGQVTAISPTSITVQNTRTGTSSTLSITSSTEISDNGQTGTTSDISSGDTVFITESSSDTSQASRIIVNPSFGGNPGGPDQSTSPTSGTSATSD